MAWCFAVDSEVSTVIQGSLLLFVICHPRRQGFPQGTLLRGMDLWSSHHCIHGVGILDHTALFLVPQSGTLPAIWYVGSDTSGSIWRNFFLVMLSLYLKALLDLCADETTLSDWIIENCLSIP